MFTIYQYKVEDRAFDRYYHSFENAKKSLEQDVAALVERRGWKITRKIDRMNHCKGFYEFQYDLITDSGENATLSLIEGHFVDD